MFSIEVLVDGPVPERGIVVVEFWNGGDEVLTPAVSLDHVGV